MDKLPRLEEPAVVTVADVLSEFWRHGNATNRWSRESAALRRHLFDLFLESYGTVTVDKLKPFMLREWVERDPALKNGTRKSRSNAIRAAFQWAAENERIDRNPFAFVRYVDDGEPRKPMPDDALSAMCSAANRRLEDTLIFLRATGCRIGEMIGLDWSDVDLEKGLAVVRAHKTRKYTKRDKVLVLIPDCVALLRQIRRGLPDDYVGPVFLSSRRTRWTSQGLGQSFRWLRDKLGIDRNLCLHSIRHAVATEALKSGAPMKYVSLLLGHANQATTERNYAHVTADYEGIARTAELAQPKPNALDAPAVLRFKGA